MYRCVRHISEVEKCLYFANFKSKNLPERWEEILNVKNRERFENAFKNSATKKKKRMKIKIRKTKFEISRVLSSLDRAIRIRYHQPIIQIESR